MLINTSFSASKEEDFAFSFPLPVKSFTASCLAKGHGLEPEIQDYINSWLGNFKTMSSSFTWAWLHCLPELSCQHSWPCPRPYGHHIMPSSLTVRSTKRGDLLEPWTQSAFRSSCRAENKSLGRRYHRKADVEGINKPSSLYFTLMTSSSMALRWQTLSLWKGVLSLVALWRCG